jgi:hypothetical protein
MRSSSGGGQASLAIAWHLKRQGLRFVELEAESELGHTWRDRWDSLKLFTPAQYDGLPGMPFPAPADTYPTKGHLGRRPDAGPVPEEGDAAGGHARMTLKEEKIQDDRIRRTPAIGCQARTPSPGVRPCGSGVRHGVVRSSRRYPKCRGSVTSTVSRPTTGTSDSGSGRTPRDLRHCPAP